MDRPSTTNPPSADDLACDTIGGQSTELRVLQIVPTLEQEASGPSHSVPLLCQSLAQAGHQVILASVGSVWFTEDRGFVHHVAQKDYINVPVLDGLWFSRGLRKLLMQDALWAQVVHSHGLWVMPDVYPALAARRALRPLVHSPRGTLSPVALTRSRLLKRAFWTLVQGPAIRSAACLHATSELEYDDIRRFGLKQPVAILPNGVDVPQQASVARNATKLRTLLYLGRIHPIKGVDNLLKAWARLADDFADWQLRIVGPAEPMHRAQVEQLANELHLKRISIQSARYGAEKHAEYHNSELYILPSHSENFGMTVAEALAHGVPVISTTGTPWRRVTEIGCGWSVPPDATALAQVLREALRLPSPALAGMGQLGKAWMETEFTWPRIAAQFEQLYRWVLSGGPVPTFVRMD